MAKFGASITRTVRVPMENGKTRYTVEIMNDGDTVTVGTVWGESDHFNAYTVMSTDEFRAMLVAVGLITE